MNHNATLQVLASGLLLFFTACATTNPPTQQLTETSMVIQQAEQLDADEFAPLEIRQARIKLEQAYQAVDEKEYEKAMDLAEQARVDAELAQAKARSAKAVAAVAELRESIRVLKSEIERNQEMN